MGLLYTIMVKRNSTGKSNVRRRWNRVSEQLGYGEEGG